MNAQHIYECKPFKAKLKSPDVWVVEGTLEEGFEKYPILKFRKALQPHGLFVERGLFTLDNKIR